MEKQKETTAAVETAMVKAREGAQPFVLDYNTKYLIGEYHDTMCKLVYIAEVLKKATNGYISFYSPIFPINMKTNYGVIETIAEALGRVDVNLTYVDSNDKRYEVHELPLHEGADPYDGANYYQCYELEEDDE